MCERRVISRKEEKRGEAELSKVMKRGGGGRWNMQYTGN